MVIILTPLAEMLLCIQQSTAWRATAWRIWLHNKWRKQVYTSCTVLVCLLQLRVAMKIPWHDFYFNGSNQRESCCSMFYKDSRERCFETKELRLLARKNGRRRGVKTGNRLERDSCFLCSPKIHSNHAKWCPLKNLYFVFSLIRYASAQTATLHFVTRD